MGLGCGASLLKFLLIFLNVIFFLLGAAALGLGVWAYVDNSSLHVLAKIGVDPDVNMPGLLQSGALVLMIGGGIVFVISMIGCCGAVWNKKWLLGLYAAVLIIILIIEIAAVIVAAIFSSKIEGEMRKYIIDTAIKKHYDGNLKTEDPLSIAIDTAQIEFSCCGYENYTEFSTSIWNKTLANGATAQIPYSCCQFTNPGEFPGNADKLVIKYQFCQTKPDDKNSWIHKGCRHAVEQWVRDKAVIIIAIAATVVLVELLCAMFACCLIRAIRKESGK